MPELDYIHTVIHGLLLIRRSTTEVPTTLTPTFTTNREKNLLAPY